MTEREISDMGVETESRVTMKVDKSLARKAEKLKAKGVSAKSQRVQVNTSKKEYS